MLRYCSLPIRPDAPAVRTRLYRNGVLLDEQLLSIGQPAQMWAELPLPGGSREEYALRFAGCAEDASRALAALAVFGETRQGGTAYGEALRPAVHFTPRCGFHNDPNGLLYYNGLYHMFFQLNPYGLRHGNTHWGWAVSRDLLHWTERQPPLRPSEEDGLIYSGSGVVDWNNTSGLQTGEHPPIVLFYTATGARFPSDFGQAMARQCVAVSLDGGEHFYKHGCVLDEIAPMNRDPKVRWVADAGCWVMALYLEKNDYALLYSDNLLHWQRGETLTLPFTAECPDLFELFLDGDPRQPKWVLFGSPENYLVGHFEGRRFIAETELIRGPAQPEGQGKVFTRAALYAPQTFSGLPRGEEIQLYWMPTIFPAMPFSSCMSLPWRLSLQTTAEGPRLSAAPVEAVKTLREQTVALDDPALDSLEGDALDLELRPGFDSPEGRLLLRLRGVPVLLQRGGRELVFPDGIYALPEPSAPLRILADHGSVELFCGRFHCGLNTPLDPGKRGLEILTQEHCRPEGTLSRLRSVWIDAATGNK